MQPQKQHSWTNLVEIKSQLIKKLGKEKSKQYLDYLNRFLSLKLSKTDFDKLCLKTLGKDNIRLHNQLIHTVLKNACTKAPPRTVENKNQSGQIHHQNGHIPVVTQITSPLTLTNGDILPRTGPRDQKSALGPNGKTNHSSFSSSVPPSGDFNVILENGGHKEVNILKHVSDKFSVNAPLGVLFCPVSIGGAHKVLLPSKNSNRSVSLQHNLLETKTLKDRMEQIATANGVQQVSMDCANVLNRGLDCYLKGLIRSCTQLKGARPIHEPIKDVSVNVNGVRTGHHLQIQPEPERERIVTLLDFRVAMELDSKQLGEDWPVLLEKIYTRDFDE